MFELGSSGTTYAAQLLCQMYQRSAPRRETLTACKAFQFLDKAGSTVHYAKYSSEALWDWVSLQQLLSLRQMMIL